MAKNIWDVDPVVRTTASPFDSDPVFTPPSLDVAALKRETEKYEKEVPFTQRITDPLKQGIASLSGLIPGLEVSSIQKEINAIREGKRGTYDPTTGERLPFQPEDEENAIKMLQERQKEAQAKVMASQAKAGEFRTRPAVAALSDVKTAKEAFQAFQVDPLGVMSSVSLQSLPQIVPALVLGAVTRNPTVGALAMGSTSFASELSSGVTEYFQEQGIDTRDPVAVNKALNNPELFAKAYENALTRGSIIAAADTAAAGLASKMLVPKGVIKGQFAKEAANIGVAQPVAQMISGAGGEALAQVATEGEVSRPGRVLLEAAGEGPTSIAETAAFGGKRALDQLKGTQTPIDPKFKEDPVVSVEPEAAPSSVTVEQAPAEYDQATPLPPVSESQDTAAMMAELEGRPLETITPVTPPAAVAPVTPEPPVEARVIPELTTQELPISELKLSKDVPQFKSGASEKGVVEPLTGKFDRTGVAPIQVWERANGDLEVISGRHRLDLAKRTGEETIPAQIHREVEGFDAVRAASLDALLNIREGQGKVKDYVQYFQAPGYTREEAESSGVLARATGQRAYAIATNGSPDLIASHRADQLTDEAATRIANTAPQEDALQALGIKMIQDGKSITNTINTMQAVKAMSSERGETTLDMFGFDDSAMKEAQEMAKIAARKQSEISNDLAAVTGAAKRPETAKKYGINVNNPAEILAKTEQLRQQRAAWDNWSSSPELIGEIRAEMRPTVELQPTTPAQLQAQEEATKAAQAKEDAAAAKAEKETRAEREKKEIAQQSKRVADTFELGQAPDESLSGQADIFGEPEDKGTPTLSIERRAAPDTAAFKKWFGSSKIVNEDGSPKVMYHGTDKDFDEFIIAQKANRTSMPDGFYFTSDINEANAYAQDKDGANIMPVYLRIKNPFDLQKKNKITNEMVMQFRDELRKENPNLSFDWIKSKVDIFKENTEKGRFPFPNITFSTAAMKRVFEVGGYDGLLDGGNHVVAFNSNQIKSAIGNTGAFSSESANITLSMEDRKNAAPITRARLANERILEEKIAELAKTNIRRAAIRNRFEKDKLKPLDQREAASLREIADELVDDIDTLKFVTRDLSAENFDYLAGKALKEKTISREVRDLIGHIFKTRPDLLEGLKLQVRSPGENGPRAAGEFLGRIIRLYKGTSGVEDPAVFRHELTHSLEQMMPKEVKKKLVKVWGDKVVAAEKAEKTLVGKQFFEALKQHLQNPTIQSFESTSNQMPDMSYYQYMSPSEYWAVNAEPLMNAQLGGAWKRFQKFVRGLFESLKEIFGIDNKSMIYKTFNQVINGERLDTNMLVDYGRGVVPTYSMNPRKNYKGDKPPLSQWTNPADSMLDNFAYAIQDKLIDTKRVIQQIKKSAGEIAEKFDAYMKEELYYGRTAKRTEEFLKSELLPIVEEMKAKNVTIAEFDEYLHNRHAEERNEQIARVNPNLPDEGSGISTEDANNYLDNLDPKKKADFESLAAKLDGIVAGTQQFLVDNGLETEDTIQTWNDTYKHYVPLMRDDLDFVHHGKGYGQGFQVRGSTVKRATGSKKEVVDIFANIALQRERAIVRAERARVGRALYGLAIQNPNPDFWLPVNPDAIKNKTKLEEELINLGLNPEDAVNLIQEPKTAKIDKRTGKVIYEINPYLRNSDNVFAVRIDGKDRYLFLNSSDPRAMRMAQSLKNLDAEQLGLALGSIGQVTRWIASVNTQYNPVFGAWNFTRDVGSAAFNLSTTELAGKQAEVAAGVFPALFGIYGELRAGRKGKKQDTDWAKLFEKFQMAGGQTGYKDQFTKQKISFKGLKPESKQINVIEQSFKDMDKSTVRKAVSSIFNWLSDYNDAMENAVRLSAFKVGLDQGLSEDKAASIAKNLTVNFNRKGKLSPTLGALFAFFNSAVQGTTRLGETLAGPAGKKIIAGGITVGVFQALALALAGFDDDDPPTFLKDKNLIIPTGDGKYVVIPMPLGFNVIPGVGRISTEYVLGKMGLISGSKDLSKKAIDLAGLVLSSFNPLGGGTLTQVITPTVADPIVSLATNQDAFGRPISRQDRNTAPTPGYTRSRDNASFFSQKLAEYLNYASGGTKYKKGELSPTADQIDYLIGQATGGVGREVQKVSETIKSQFTGEELPTYRKPLVGKIFGDINSPAAVSARFYQNVTEMAQHENEIKGRQKNRENVREYFKEHPEAKMIDQANRIENDISKMNRDKRELMERNAPKEQIKRIEDRKINIMRQFNQRVVKMSQKKEGE
jgi:hypothetical protein